MPSVPDMRLKVDTSYEFIFEACVHFIDTQPYMVSPDGSKHCFTKNMIEFVIISCSVHVMIWSTLGLKIDPQDDSIKSTF